MITGHEIHEYLGLTSTQDCYGVYAGFQEIDGHRACTKIGRSKNAQAIQRGRAQGGANWWFESYFSYLNVPSDQTFSCIFTYKVYINSMLSFHISIWTLPVN